MHKHAQRKRNDPAAYRHSRAPAAARVWALRAAAWWPKLPPWHSSMEQRRLRRRAVALSGRGKWREIIGWGM